MKLPEFQRPTGRTLGLFAAIWLAVGFAAGTLTLLGPVRWATSALRGAGTSDMVEKAVVLTIIVAYVAASFVASLFISRWSLRQNSWRVAIGPAVAWSLALACVWAWMTPAVVNSFQPVQVESVARFTFGPYPERERFEQLRADGYTAVVSLLHPAVVPFEPQLIARERELAAEFGLEFIHAPMLPWIGDNGDSLDRIKELAGSDRGRYYVHCYLGRDRVGTVRALIERIATNTVVADFRPEMAVRAGFDKAAFERGEIVELEPGVFLSPYPTDEEMFKYFAGGYFAHVVSLLDPNNGPDLPGSRRSERCSRATVAFTLLLLPIDFRRLRPARGLQVARAIRSCRAL